MYTPILIVAFQVAASIMYLIDVDFYVKNIWTISGFAGMNWIFSLLLLALTFYLPFCGISRCCAIAECALSLMDIVTGGNPDYNMWIQLILGGLALIITGIIFNTKKE